jgi:hypothetical protein
MAPEDEVELIRLTAALRAVSQAQSVFSQPTHLEAVHKAMIAIILCFQQGGRPDIEEHYALSHQPLEGSLAPSDLENLMFYLKDTQVWVRAMEANPEKVTQIENGQFPPGSLGEFLQDALDENRKRLEAGNVSPLKPIE